MNKQQKHNISSTGLLALCLLLSLGSAAQTFFNRLYTLQATAATFEAVAPHGSAGGFMAAATVRDSGTGKQAVRIGRFDADGTEQASTYFNIPDDTDRSIYVNFKTMARVHDNCYAMAGKVQQLKKPGLYSFILLADSNGHVYRYADLTDRDSINLIGSIRYDGNKHLIAAGYYVNKIRDSALAVIYKFDTGLNLIWFRQYWPAAMKTGGFLAYDLAVAKDGYVLAGGSNNATHPSTKEYKAEAVLLHTDTAGNPLWSWASPLATYADYKSSIAAIIRTQDGGYLFTTKGLTYNSLDPSYPIIRLKAKQMIIKLDAARNKLWETVIDDYFTGYGYIPASLLELADGSFMFLGSKTYDSTAPLVQISSLMLQHYSSSGVLLDQHNMRNYLPRAVDDTHPESGGPINHIIQLPDKGFLLAGWYENRTTGAPEPRQRGWLLKLDSNGCLGPADTQCRPTAIRDPQQAELQFAVYPNPSKEIFTITATNVMPQGSLPAARQGFLHATVYDLTGRIIYRQALTFSNKTATINLQSPPGLYLLELSSPTGERYRQKIIVE